MSVSVQAPARAPRRRRRWSAWLAIFLSALTLATVAYGTYHLGQRSGTAAIWDPLWVRAYLDRPLDVSSPGTGFWIAGYHVDYDQASLDVVKTRANHMDQVVIFGYGFDRQGDPIGKDQEIMKGVTGSQKRILLFSNLTNGAFDKDTAHAILTEPAIQSRALQVILDKVALMQVSGVQIDFEEILPEDRNAYTAFLKRLKGQLQPKGLTLSIAAAAKTRDSTTGWGGATDYVAVGQIVDQFYIMAYDEHWRGGEPGPVASLPWVERVVRYATGVIPAQKIVLGVPFYGYEWAVETKQGSQSNRAYGSFRMVDRVAKFGGQAKWDPVSGENVATFKTEDGDRIAWYPDQRSLEAKLKLAYQYNLKGVALWRLGFEPDAWWNQLGAFRVQPAK